MRANDKILINGWIKKKKWPRNGGRWIFRGLLAFLKTYSMTSGGMWGSDWTFKRFRGRTVNEARDRFKSDQLCFFPLEELVKGEESRITRSFTSRSLDSVLDFKTIEYPTEKRRMAEYPVSGSAEGSGLRYVIIRLSN